MKILPECLLIVFKYSMTSEALHKHFHNFQTFVKYLDFSIFFLLSLILLAQVTYNQVQPFQIYHLVNQFQTNLSLTS